MTFIVTREGIAPATEAPDYVALDALAETPGEALSLDLPTNAPVDDALAGEFGRITAIRINFPAMGDGRGFSQARRLRDLGFGGTLRASGPMISDQLRAAFRVGFDEIEVADAVAARQPPEHWKVRDQGYYQRRVLS